MNKAIQMLVIAKQTFQSLCSSLPGMVLPNIVSAFTEFFSHLVPVTDDVVKEWMEVLNSTLTHDVNQQHSESKECE